MQEFINWTTVSSHLTGLKTTVRKHNYPNKYKKQIELLLWYVDCWKKGIELTTKEGFKTEMINKIKEI